LITDFFDQQVVVVHLNEEVGTGGDPEVDSYGDPILTETVDRDTYKGWLTQTSGEEMTVDRDTRISDWEVSLPAEAVIDANDQVIAQGKTFEVIGPPAQARQPGRVHHIVARLRWIEG
jgi:hypothetical protein